jgi:hypothetical protein
MCELVYPLLLSCINPSAKLHIPYVNCLPLHQSGVSLYQEVASTIAYTLINLRAMHATKKTTSCKLIYLPQVVFIEQLSCS